MSPKIITLGTKLLRGAEKAGAKAKQWITASVQRMSTTQKVVTAVGAGAGTAAGVAGHYIIKNQKYDVNSTEQGLEEMVSAMSQWERGQDNQAALDRLLQKESDLNASKNERLSKEEQEQLENLRATKNIVEAIDPFATIMNLEASEFLSAMVASSAEDQLIERNRHYDYVRSHMRTLFSDSTVDVSRFFLSLGSLLSTMIVKDSRYGAIMNSMMVGIILNSSNMTCTDEGYRCICKRLANKVACSTLNTGASGVFDDATQVGEFLNGMASDIQGEITII